MQDEPSEWHYGRVQGRGPNKDFGWITCPEVGTVFVHLESFKTRPARIHKGMKVRFRFKQDPGKPNPRAVDAEMIS